MAFSSIQNISNSCLPSEFINVISSTDSAKKCVIVRSNLKTMADIDIWVQAFGKKTNTQWNLRSSCPVGKKIVCSRKFVCHHSSFMKIPANKNKKGCSKNANCHASILITIKLDTINTRKKDSFIKGSNQLQGVISIYTEHSHTLETAETLRFLQASSETRETFFEYFNDRMTISEAKKYHERLYEFQPDKEMFLASGSANPTYRTIQHWYHTWRKINLGPRTGKCLINKLKEKQEAYEKQNTVVRFSENPFAVAIVTPLMARAQAAQFSNEVCFVDSTSSCDAELHSITFVMVPCAAGAIPLGVIITKGQTFEAYSKGFQLLQEIAANSLHPKIFLTDNSEAEILAINSVFPNSVTLLCIFHVLQAVWRWLWDSKHGISKEDRQYLMKSFRNMLYSRTPPDAEKAFFNCICTKYEHWVNYVQNYWNFKEKWCLAWRNADSKGHYTNNFCEATIRLFKDNILCRVKAYNVIALIDVVATVLEDFYKRRLREFANSRTSTARCYFFSMMEKTNYLEKTDIVCLDDNNYIVPHENDKSEYYIINIENGCCSCFQGLEGKFCKHQCAIYKFFKVKTQYFPTITTEDRYNIAKLVLGDQVPSINFYEPFLQKDDPKSVSDDSQLNNYATCNDKEHSSFSKKLSVDFGVLPKLEAAQINDSVSDTIDSICSLIKTCHESFGSSSSGLNILKKRLTSIKSEGQWETFIHAADEQLL